MLLLTLLLLWRRGGVGSKSDARPEGRQFEFRPIRDVRLCSWAKHFTTNCRVFSDRTLKIVGPFYLVSMPGEVKDPTRII